VIAGARTISGDMGCIMKGAGSTVGFRLTADHDSDLPFFRNSSKKLDIQLQIFKPHGVKVTVKNN
jgi:hypothetical protein